LVVFAKNDTGVLLLPASVVVRVCRRSHRHKMSEVRMTEERRTRYRGKDRRLVDKWRIRLMEDASGERLTVRVEVLEVENLKIFQG